MSFGFLLKRNGPEEYTPQEYKKGHWQRPIGLDMRSQLCFPERCYPIIVASGNNGLKFQGNKGDFWRKWVLDPAVQSFIS
jgi:hypothetical protein